MTDVIHRLTAAPGVGSSAAPPMRRARPAKRRARTDAQRTSSEQRVMDAMIIVFIVTLFVPEAIALHIGSVKLTPMFVISILLFPMLFVWGRIRWAWPELVILALFCSFFVSISLSSPLTRAIEAIGRMFLIGAVPYLVGRYVIQDTRRLTRFLSLVIGLTAAFGVLALLESLNRTNIHSILWGIPYAPHPEDRLGMTRAYGWTTHSIMYGLVNAIFLPIVLVAVIEKMRVVGKWTVLKALGLGLGCFLSLSTGAWGPAVLSLLFVAWDYLCKVKPLIRWPVTFSLMIGGYYTLEVLANRPLLRILMMDLHLSSPEAWYYRWTLYRRVYDVMPGHWWLGHGLFVPPGFRGWGWSIDNNFLVILMQYGRIGLALWIGLFAAVFLYGGKAVWAGLDTPYVRFTRAIMFGVIGITLTQLSVALFSTPHVLYWLMLGLAVGASQNCAREAKQIKARRAARSRKARRREPANRRGPKRTTAAPRLAPAG